MLFKLCLCYIFKISYNFLTRHQYYLVDVEYLNEYGYLSPYKNKRYHFQTFRCRGQPTSREGDSIVHSSLHNVIESAFGVWKQR